MPPSPLRFTVLHCDKRAGSELERRAAALRYEAEGKKAGNPEIGENEPRLHSDWAERTAFKTPLRKKGEWGQRRTDRGGAEDLSFLKS